MIELTRNDLQFDRKKLPIDKITLYDFHGSAMSRDEMCKADQIIFIDDDLIVKKLKNTFDKTKKIYLIRQVNCCAGGTDIIGLTDDIEIAKSMQSVFCSYEEVKYLKFNKDGNRIYD